MLIFLKSADLFFCFLIILSLFIHGIIDSPQDQARQQHLLFGLCHWWCWATRAAGDVRICREFSGIIEGPLRYCRSPCQ